MEHGLPGQIMQLSTRDRLDGRGAIVAHTKRHHLYQTARAYLSAGRLNAFATLNFVGAPARVRWLTYLPLRRVRNAVGKVIGYSDALLAPHVIVQARTRGRALVMRALGNRVRRRALAFDEFVAELCRETGSALHMGCVHATRPFERLKGSGLPLVLEQYVADRRMGREVMLGELDRLGVALDEAMLNQMGYSQERVAQNERDYELADTIVAIAPFVARSLEERGVGAEKIITAPLGADVGRFRPGTFLRLKHGEVLRVAFVGNDAVRKGLIYAADAARGLKGRVKIDVFGKTRLPGSLSDDRSDVIEYHGPLPQATLARALTTCHAAVMPSLWEGYGMSVYECMAAGLPTIVSDHVPAEVQEGEGAFVVPIRDAGAIAGHFERLLDDEYRQEASRRGVAYVRLRQWDRYHQALQRGLGLIGPDASGSVSQANM